MNECSQWKWELWSGLALPCSLRFHHAMQDLRHIRLALLIEKLQERFSFGIARPQFQRPIEIGSRPHQIRPVQQMIQAQEQVRPGVPRPHVRDALGDLGGLVEHFKLMIFRREKIEPRVVPGVGRDLFLQDLNIPVVLTAPRFAVCGKSVIDPDACLL